MQESCSTSDRDDQQYEGRNQQKQIIMIENHGLCDWGTAPVRNDRILLGWKNSSRECKAKKILRNYKNKANRPKITRNGLKRAKKAHFHTVFGRVRRQCPVLE